MTEQDDVKKLPPDLQLEAVVLPRTNKFPGLCFIDPIVTKILIWVILVVIYSIDNIKISIVGT